MAPYSSLDDYDEDFEAESFRWMSVVVLLLAVFGFFALAWYAYNHGVQQARNQDVIIVEAEDGPLKMAPEDEGGMEFPHREKQLYNVYKDVSPKHDMDVEKIVDDSQAPVPMVKDEPVRTWVNEALTSNNAEEDILIDPALIEQQKGKKKVAALDKKAEELQKMLIKSKTDTNIANKMIDKKPSVPARKVSATPTPIARPVTSLARLENPEPKSKPSDAHSGGAYNAGYKVQLAALRSEEEAQTQWKRIRSSHLDILSDAAHRIIRADLGAKGVYYRLRVGGLASAQKAKELCNILSGRKQPCMVIGK